jgi:hypothetical protein
MILHPAVMALLTGSLLVSLMAVYSSYYGGKILKGWDLKSGSESQLGLEKRTYLISTMMYYVFAFQILSFFLFVYTADDLHTLFVGAMCAAGTLNVNGYGYPALIVKIGACLFAGLWLIVNHADNQAPDYPLIRAKYAFLLAVAPVIIGDAILQGAYFLSLKAQVITSCCGSLFSAGAEGVAAGLASLPVIPMEAAFFGLMLLTFMSGIYFYVRKSPASGLLFSLSGTAAFFVSAAALIAFISLYFYELPTHHCPFCILQGEYHYGGYLIYTTLLGGAIAGAGTGVLMPFRSVASLRDVIPRLQKRLTGAALLLYAVFTAMALWGIITSDLILTGY